jgi:TM2 domain-containing membrane protein YozV
LNDVVPTAESRNASFVEGDDSHSALIGYLLWIFGFMGAHRFYFGKKKTGTLYFFTLGLLGIGWLIDAFLIPGMNRQADVRYTAGPTDYSVTWLLLTFLGVFGVHRFYMGKIFTGILYLCTAGLFGIGVLYDFWTMNEQVSELNTPMH